MQPPSRDGVDAAWRESFWGELAGLLLESARPYFHQAEPTLIDHLSGTFQTSFVERYQHLNLHAERQNKRHGKRKDRNDNGDELVEAEGLVEAGPSGVRTPLGPVTSESHCDPASEEADAEPRRSVDGKECSSAEGLTPERIILPFKELPHTSLSPPATPRPLTPSPSPQTLNQPPIPSLPSSPTQSSAPIPTAPIPLWRRRKTKSRNRLQTDSSSDLSTSLHHHLITRRSRTDLAFDSFTDLTGGKGESGFAGDISSTSMTHLSTSVSSIASQLSRLQGGDEDEEELDLDDGDDNAIQNFGLSLRRHLNASG
ncbi:hypothetical protein HDU67_001740, partial [Dinochytrium kinnereticum]